MRYLVQLWYVEGRGASYRKEEVRTVFNPDKKHEHGKLTGIIDKIRNGVMHGIKVVGGVLRMS